MDKNINKYIEYLMYQRKYSNYTCNEYLEDLNFFKDYLKRECLNYLDIEYSDIRLFFSYLEEKKYSKNTISRKISSIRGFYKYLARNKIIESNPFLLTSSIKKDKLIPKFLYYNELESLFESCNDTSLFGLRDRLFLELLYATGMRVGEVEYIKISDIDTDNLCIKVLGKGNKERYVFFGEYVLEYLDLYLSKREDSCPYLFINKNKERLTARGMRLILNKIITNSSLDIKISPHTLRHTFATHLINEGCDLLSIKELLGHSSLKATEVYTHITSETLRNTYLNSHPRGHKTIEDKDN